MSEFGSEVIMCECINEEMLPVAGASWRYSGSWLGLRLRLMSAGGGDTRTGLH